MAGNQYSMKDFTRISPRFRAVIDWMDVIIQLSRPSNFWTVQELARESLQMGGLPYARPLDEAPGRSASRFIIRVHDPKSARQIEALAAHIADGLGCSVTIAGIEAIEIALDTYGVGPEFVIEQYRFSTALNNISDNHRIFRRIADGIPRRIAALTQHIADGWQIGIGNKGKKNGVTTCDDTREERGDDWYMHLYFKVWDGSLPPGQRNLSGSERRARFEIRLREAGLPCHSWEDLKRLCFESLAREYFAFRELRHDLSASDARLAQWYGTANIGQSKDRRRSTGGKRLGFSRLTQASRHNKAIHDAFRDLSKRWKSTISRGRPSASSSVPATQISGELNAESRMDAGIVGQVLFTTIYVEPSTGSTGSTGSEATDAAHDTREQRDLIHHTHDTDRAGSLTLTSTNDQIEDATRKVNDSLRSSSTDHDADNGDRRPGRLSASPPTCTSRPESDSG